MGQHEVTRPPAQHEMKLALLFLGLEGGEQALLRLHVGKQRGRNEMGVGIDDQVVLS